MGFKSRNELLEKGPPCSTTRRWLSPITACCYISGLMKRQAVFAVRFPGSLRMIPLHLITPYATPQCSVAHQAITFCYFCTSPDYFLLTRIKAIENPSQLSAVIHFNQKKYWRFVLLNRESQHKVVNCRHLNAWLSFHRKRARIILWYAWWHDTLQNKWNCFNLSMPGKIHSHSEHDSKQNSIFEDDLKIIRSLIRAPINFANLLRNSLLCVKCARRTPVTSHQIWHLTHCYMSS